MTSTAEKNPVFLALQKKAKAERQLAASPSYPLGASAIQISIYCKHCHCTLSLTEMHYFDDGEGAATCTKCEERASLG